MLLRVDVLMPIGEFSQRSGLSARRLRNYAAVGLLVPAAIDPASGYRFYAAGQIQAALIDALRNAGVPLTEVAAVLRQPSSERLDVWVRHVQADADRRHEALDLARSLLADVGSPAQTNTRLKGKTMHLILMTSARTDIGRVRENNEDALLCLDHVVAVADGRGGHPGGQLASSLAVAILEAAFTGRSGDALEAAVRAANRAIFERAKEDGQLEGMGTTLCVLGPIGGAHLAIANVGDSRACLVRDGVLTQLTEDHSVAADLVRQGNLTRAQAAHHPQRGWLTRAVGVGQNVEVDTFLQPVHAGDRVVVCSDGLFNEVAEEQIMSVMSTARDRDEAADELVRHALTNGGHDNVTVVIADVGA